ARSSEAAGMVAVKAGCAVMVVPTVALLWRRCRIWIWTRHQEIAAQPRAKTAEGIHQLPVGRIRKRLAYGGHFLSQESDLLRAEAVGEVGRVVDASELFEHVRLLSRELTLVQEGAEGGLPFLHSGLRSFRNENAQRRIENSRGGSPDSLSPAGRWRNDTYDQQREGRLREMPSRQPHGVLLSRENLLTSIYILRRISTPVRRAYLLIGYAARLYYTS